MNTILANNSVGILCPIFRFLILKHFSVFLVISFLQIHFLSSNFSSECSNFDRKD